MLVEAVTVKSGQRNRRDADFARQPLAEIGFRQAAFGHFQTRDVDALEVAAGAGQDLELGAFQAGAEQVALALVKGRQLKVGRGVGHVLRQRVLHRRVDREHVELVHLAELGAQRSRRRHVADLPAGHVVGLAKAADDEGARRQAGKACRALVRCAVEHHVLIHLVADQQDVGGRQQFLQRQHFRFAPDRGAGVVRAVDQDGAGARRDRGGDAVEVRAEAAGRQRHAHHAAAGQFDVGHVAVVAGLQHDHLIARSHDSQDRRDDRLRGPGRDGNFAVWRVFTAIHCFYFASNGVAQRRDARHRRVLIQPGLHGVRDGVDQGRIAGKIRKTLAQVDGAGFAGEGRHHGEDGGADGRQLGLEGGGAGRSVHSP